MEKIPTQKTSKCVECLILERRNKHVERRLASLTKSKGGKPAQQRYFDEKGLAARWDMSVKTLQNWRHKGIGPKWEKIGRAVRYRLRDILTFEKSFPSGGGNSE
jgi:hypothetical protein